MRVITDRFEVSTRGHTDIVDVTERVAAIVRRSGLKEGQATVFVGGSTAAITTIEYEPGLLRDLPEVYDRLVPAGVRYHHDATWGDGNGYAHVRAALTGSTYIVPFEKGRLLLGTWQQIVLIDFDNRPRQRRIVVQMIGV